MVEFVPFQKIPRLSRDVVVTEKIDGTNGVVHVSDAGEVTAGSRTRWITKEDDNFGFARWVWDHAAELQVGLGPGTHYGEWWGAGVGRRYGLTFKKFSLFNVHRWADDAVRPECCDVVPVLYRGPFDMAAIWNCLTKLRVAGSVASPGFMNPEGIIVFHTAGNVMFKKTLEKDEESQQHHCPGLRGGASCCMPVAKAGQLCKHCGLMKIAEDQERVRKAAPELLAALKDLIGCIGRDGYFPQAGKPRTDAARAAIAKAEGAS